LRPRSRQQQLGARRRALTARSEALRARLVADAGQAHRSLGMARLAGSALQALTRHPAVLAAGAVALSLAGPRRTLRIAVAAVSAWSLFKRARFLAELFRRLAARA
jgi:hypothetical protein